MDRKLLIKWTCWSVVGAGLGTVVLHGGLRQKTGLDRAWHVLSHSMESIQAKVDSIKTAEEDSIRLKLENAELRIKLANAKFSCTSKNSDKLTKDFSSQVKNEKIESKLRRVMSGIGYQVPEDLLPEQLHTLGVGYLKAKEEDRAAFIFSYLGTLDETDQYKTPQNFVLAGVAWYRVKQYDLSDYFFSKVLETKPTDETLPYFARARLWRSVVAQKGGKPKDAQKWLSELLEQHPHSSESALINRSVASEPAAETEDEATHGEAAHGEAAHGEAAHGEAAHGEAAHGEAAHGEAAHGEAAHGDVKSAAKNHAEVAHEAPIQHH